MTPTISPTGAPIRRAQKLSIPVSIRDGETHTGSVTVIRLPSGNLQIPRGDADSERLAREICGPLDVCSGWSDLLAIAGAALAAPEHASRSVIMSRGALYVLAVGSPDQHISALLPRSRNLAETSWTSRGSLRRIDVPASTAAALRAAQRLRRWDWVPAIARGIQPAGWYGRWSQLGGRVAANKPPNKGSLRV